MAQEQDISLEKKVEMQRRLGVMPKGRTGCNTCDWLGYLVCRCPKGGSGDGSKSDGGKENAKSAALDFGKPVVSDLVSTSKFTNPSSRTPKLIMLVRDGRKLSPEELKILAKLFGLIANEFEKFKQELKKLGIVVTHYNAIIKEDRMVLNIPNRKHYDMFILRLLDKNLLQMPDIQSLKQDESRPSVIRPRSPLSTKLIR